MNTVSPSEMDKTYNSQYKEQNKNFCLNMDPKEGELSRWRDNGLENKGNGIALQSGDTECRGQNPHSRLHLRRDSYREVLGGKPQDGQSNWEVLENSAHGVVGVEEWMGSKRNRWSCEVKESFI